MVNSDTLRRPAASRALLGWLLIAVGVTAAYAPALTGGLLWDDDGHLCPPALRSLSGLWRIWTDLGATQQYYPLLHSAFWLEHQLWGDAVVGYHLVNVLLHATASGLVILLARRLTLRGAWLAGLLFALHPVCVESVAWISEQKNTLSTVFALAATLVFLRFNERRRPADYAIASLLFAAALLTKTVTAMIPVALGILLWWRHGRVRWREDVLSLTPWLAAGATAGLFTAWVERTYIGASGADFSLSVVERLLLAAHNLWFYLFKLVWPSELVFIYPRWQPNATDVVQYVAVAGLVVTLVSSWLLRRHCRGPLAAALAYAALLFPALGFFNVYPFLFSYTADHFQYLASIAVILPAGALIATALARLPRWTAALLPMILLSALAVLTFRQSRQYRDAETLYRATLARNPDCWLALNNLGNVVAAQSGRSSEAVALYESALRVRPGYPEAHFNLANTLARSPATRATAFAHYEAALRLRPRYADAHNNYGIALSREPGRQNEAIAHFEAAIRDNPTLATAHSNLGTALARIPSRVPEAVGHYRTAVRLAPNYATAHFDLANALAKSPEYRAEAIAEYEDALRLDPQYAEAHYNLATQLTQTPGREADAIRHFEEALRLRPEWDFVRQALSRIARERPGAVTAPTTK